MVFNYPLQLRFKLLALASRVIITDNSNKEVLYIEQKVFAIRELIRIYNNETEKQQMYGMKAKQIIDIGAQYFFYQGADEVKPIGSVKEAGLKTLIKATYTIYDKSDTAKFIIKELNPWLKVADFIVTQIPFLGLLAGYFFNPSYQVINSQTNNPVLLLKKQPSFMERQFSIEVLDQTISAEDETICLLGILMMTLLQKNRG